MLLFTAPRDALLAPLQSVSGIVEKRHTLPILSNVLIEKKGDALTLLATDIEIQIRNSTPATPGAEDVAITVGARKLQDILRALPDTADVSLTLDDKRITLKAGKSRFQLQTLPAADYPRLNPPEDAGARLTIGQRAFKRQLGVKRVVWTCVDGLLRSRVPERRATGKLRGDCVDARCELGVGNAFPDQPELSGALCGNLIAEEREAHGALRADQSREEV